MTVIKDIFKITKGKKEEETDILEGSFKRYIQIEDLRHNENLKYCIPNKKSVRVNKSDLIIAWDGANAGTIGVGLEGVIGSTLAKLELKNASVNPYYAARFLQSKFQYLRDSCTGATIPHISKTVLENLSLPLPTFETQKKIVEVLDRVRGLIDVRKEQIRLMNELIDSLLNSKVGPKSADYESWKSVQIKDVVKPGKNNMRTGPFGSDLLHSEFVSEGVYVLGIDNVVTNRFNWGKERYITQDKYMKLKRYTVFPGDVLISIMGTTGRSAVVPDNIPLAINSKHLACITPDINIIHPLFLSLSITKNQNILRQIKMRNKGAIMNGLNLGIIKELELKLPPIEDQNEFAKVFMLISEQIGKICKSLSLMEEKFEGISQKAFTGDLFGGD
ncbi:MULTISPECIES: restriction endonuclease subunit S [unclassified Paenibacillus]|uniref:restriction endonuclease subunit S n=1 Tax=unclassified Paenibacillus TaxID=185978 RepID=UPI000424D734|nr:MULTISPECIES: restriction endonuclease subunit S [unclassified Paenibacillus]